MKMRFRRNRATPGPASGPFHDPRTPAVPLKAHAARNHHIPKQRHRVTDWAEYDAALRQRHTREAIAFRRLLFELVRGARELVEIA
jgi:hypothetical protein